MNNYRHVFSIQETDCQVYHVCGAQDAVSPISSLLCPNGTLYNQQYFVCDWWFNVDCSVVSILSYPSVKNTKISMQFSLRKLVK